MSRNVVIIIVVLLVAVIGVYFLKSSASNNSAPSVNVSDNTSPTPTESATPSASASSSAQVAQQITVEGNEYSFIPSKLNLKMGQSVEITFKNIGHVPHNLVIPDLNVGTKTIKPGEEDTVTFTPSKAGEFGFDCSVDSHALKGMKGTVLVN